MIFRTFVATWPGRLVALLIIAAVGGGVATLARANTPPPAAAPRTATVTRGSITQTVGVSGSVTASGQARLAFKTGGKLSGVFVSVGQNVTAGQPLASLDTTDLQSALATAQQNLANAQASYQKQVLAASDTQASLADTQRTTANSIANAQNALAKIKTNYAVAKTNYGTLTTGTATDLNSYRGGIDQLRTQVDQVLTDMPLYGTTDIITARSSLNAADASLANAQSYAGGGMASSLSDYTSSKDALLAAVSQFDAAIAAGQDTSAAAGAYQTAQLNYNIALSRLQSALGTVTGQVSSAQTSANNAGASLNTTTSKAMTAFDTARADLAIAQTSFTTQGLVSSTAGTKLTQAGTPLATITDALTGGLVNAINAVSNAQDQAATSLRTAQSAVANIPLNLQSASVSVQNALTSVDTAKANLDAATLTAPSAGVVASIANQIGEFVSGGNTNSAFVVLTNTTAMVLHGTIGEADISKLKLGQVANVTVDALTGSKMTGRVTSLDPVATISQGVPVYGVDVAIDLPAAGLKAGMTGTASVILASKQSVLTVLNTTIRTVGGQRGVQVLKDGAIVETPAQFGISNDTVTEVVSGLQEGDTIVIPQARASASGANQGGTRIGVPGIGGAGR